MFQAAIQLIPFPSSHCLPQLGVWSSFQSSLLSRQETYRLLSFFNLLDGYAILAKVAQFQFPDMPLKMKNEKKIIIVSVIFF
jgi:hypothetical protein